MKQLLVACVCLMFGFALMAGELNSNEHSADTANAYTSGNQLYSDCQSYQAVQARKAQEEDFLPAEMCTGYVRGVTDTLLMNQYPINLEDVKFSQIVDAVINYLQNHPEERHYTAASRVREALLAAFPQKK